jgi:CheY-like chemotaxis protein
MELKDILIIDDDRDMTRTLQAILSAHNYNVRTANDSSRGMEMLKSRIPDLLILDIMMDSELEGQNFAHTIKSNPDYRDLPVLVITGMLEAIGVNIRDSFEDNKNLPLVSMLDKPFDPDELITRVAELISNRREA